MLEGISNKAELLAKALGADDSFGARHNLSAQQLIDEALRRKEGVLSASGALVVNTSPNCGRSAADKFIVKDKMTSGTVDWSASASLSEASFDVLYKDFIDFARGKDLFVQDLYGGADKRYRYKVRVISERAWHCLAASHMLRHLDEDELEGFVPDVTIMDLPSFKADPARHGCNSNTIIACDFTQGLFLIGSTSYSGEIKKSVFTYMNYMLPDRGVLPMHCSANVGAAGDCALFFGLSGTGKTTLSADPKRQLIGDDEHGWSDHGIFNFEGGCYAKVINLSKASEPDIHQAVHTKGALWENVVLDKDTAKPDFDDETYTVNTRSAYPLRYIRNIAPSGTADDLKYVVMLTADAMGVLPPVARLSPEEAQRFFLLGYTCKIPGTEKKVTEPKVAFSACFGAPFMSRPARVYGALLRDRLSSSGVSCWLVNTGWTGGPYGIGKRMPIDVTRGLLESIFNGTMDKAQYVKDDTFGFDVPKVEGGIYGNLMDPRSTWGDQASYDEHKARLALKFEEVDSALTRLA